MKTVFASTAAPRTPRELWGILDGFAANGLTAVELGACEYVPEPSLSEKLRATGLLFVVHNYFPPPVEPFVLNLASGDADVARPSPARVNEALELSAALEAGTSFVFPMPGSPQEAHAAGERFLDAVGVALDRAEELGVRLLVENNVCTPELAGKLLLMTADEFSAFFDAFAERELGLLLDTGHLNVTAATYGFDPVAFADTVARHIDAFHLHDNDGRRDQHLPAAIGSWALDLVARPEFADAAVTVEASFDSVPALADYVRSLESLVR